VGPRSGQDAVANGKKLLAGNRTPVVQSVVYPGSKAAYLNNSHEKRILNTVYPNGAGSHLFRFYLLLSVSVSSASLM
jgi:hypothetical protein